MCIPAKNWGSIKAKSHKQSSFWRATGARRSSPSGRSTSVSCHRPRRRLYGGDGSFCRHGQRAGRRFPASSTAQNKNRRRAPVRKRVRRMNHSQLRNRPCHYRRISCAMIVIGLVVVKKSRTRMTIISADVPSAHWCSWRPSVPPSSAWRRSDGTGERRIFQLQGHYDGGSPIFWGC